MLRILLAVSLLTGLNLAAQQPPPEFDSLLASAGALSEKGDYPGATTGYLEAWKIAQDFGPTDDRRYRVLKSLSAMYWIQGKFTEAEEMIRVAIAFRELAYGRDDPAVFADMVERAGVLRGAGKLDEALAVLQYVLSYQMRTGGLKNPKSADTVVRIAHINLDKKALDEASNNFRYALGVMEDAVGKHDPSLISVLSQLSDVQIAQRDFVAAEATYRRTLILRERQVGAAHADLLQTLDGLAYSLFAQKKYVEAEPVYKRLLALWEAKAGNDHPLVAMTLEKLGNFYRERGYWEEAAAASSRSLAVRAHFMAMGLVFGGELSIHRGDRAEAIRLYEQALKTLEPVESQEVSELRAVIQKNLKVYGDVPGRGTTKAGPMRKMPMKKKAPSKGD